MRIVIQRVREASVTVDGEVVGAIGPGLLLLVGISHDDGDVDLEYLADKVLGLRIFSDALDKMNLSVRDVGGSLLAVSQFTLYGDCRKGKRPSFVAAARPELAQPLFDRFVDRLRVSGVPVATGRFGAMMEVRLLNDGPVTLILESSRTANVLQAERVPNS